MQSRNFSGAAAAFEREAKTPGANQILLLFDQGSALFAAGRFEDAVSVFLKVEDLVEIKDFTSISEEVGVLATSSNVKAYKGEDFEKVLVNVYLALSFAALGEWESAQVEARKINLLLYRMINEGKRNYSESPFARYLSGMMWEATREWNSAYVDYKNVYKLDADFPGVGRDLLALSRRLRFQDENQQWAETFFDQTPRTLGPKDAELVVVFEQGSSPIKVPRDGQNSSLPRFIPRFSRVGGAELRVNGVSQGRLETVLDIESTSIKYLEDRIGRMMAQKIAGVAAKGAIAAGIGRLGKNEDLGVLTFYALMLSDRADLRSWRSLPASLQMLRSTLPAGKHRVELVALDRSGFPIYTVVDQEIELKAGSKRFVVGR